MKRKLKYISILLSLLIIGWMGVEVASAWPLIFPRSNFSYNTKQHGIIVYSSKKIDAEVSAIVKDAAKRIAHIPILESRNQFIVFICSESRLYEKFARKAGLATKSQGFNIYPLGYTFVNLPFIKEMHAINKGKNYYNLLEGNPSHIITHEITHQLIAENIGFLKSRRLASWKQEGYCEYAASLAYRTKDVNYRLEDFVIKYFDGGYDHLSKQRKHYIESLLLTEYLLDDQGLDFETYMSLDFSKEQLLIDLKSAFSI